MWVKIATPGIAEVIVHPFKLGDYAREFAISTPSQLECRVNGPLIPVSVDNFEN